MMSLKWRKISQKKLELFLKKATQASLQIGVVSGLTLRADPDFVMHRLHQIAGHPTEGFEDRVVSGWSRHNRDHFYTVPFINQGPIHYSFTTNNPWLSSAVNSTNFIALSERRDGPISIMDYPGRMQEYLLDEVIPAFVRLLMHPKTIVGAEILTVIETLSPINPIEAYTLVHHPAVPDNKKLRRLREDLKSRLSLQHRAILNAIDMHTKSSAS